MLTLRVGATDGYDESTEQFVQHGGTVVELEHSLLSLSKWEAIHEKPFLGKEEKTPEEVLSYVVCMALDDYIPPGVLEQLSEENFTEINAYLNAKQTATWFADTPGAPQTREVITSELIYYWMTAFQIPFSCETWHLNRLFTLIRVC